MTAAEALELTLKSRKSTKEVLHAVNAMANAGHRYASFEVDSVSEEALIELKELGYTITLSTISALIEW